MYEVVASLDKRRVSKYCMVMLADHLTAITVTDHEPSMDSGGASGGRSFRRGGISFAGGVGGLSLPTGAVAVHARAASAGSVDRGRAAVALPGPAAAALRRGAFCLMACLGPSELQHLHTVLGYGMAGARRASLATLTAEFNKSFKFEGKV